MVDAYIVSNLQESLGLTDEQFVKLLPLVKRLQSDRRASCRGAAARCASCGGCSSPGPRPRPRSREQLREVKRDETEGPDRVRKTTEAIDAALTPLQQAKFRVLESEVEQRIREVIGQARRQRMAPGPAAARAGRAVAGRLQAGPAGASSPLAAPRGLSYTPETMASNKKAGKGAAPDRTPRPRRRRRGGGKSKTPGRARR